VQEKIEKFMEETKFITLHAESPHPTNVISHHKLIFKGETVDVTISTTPVNMIIGLRNGSVGFISAVIYAFAYRSKKKPFITYMAKDSSHAEITAHFLFDESVEVEKARTAVLLAEMIAGTEVTEIDFEEIGKEAKKFLSEHF
jgi:hypothetical protein